MREVVATIETEDDIFIALSRIRQMISDRFTAADQQAVFVTVLELCRNVIHYAGGCGTIICKWMESSLHIEVRDRGPGISNLDEILSGNYSSRTGLGLGIVGSKRLMDEFHIDTSERGTRIHAIKRAERPR